MATAMERLAEVYELAAHELGEKELRSFLLSEAARMRELTLPSDLEKFLEDHVQAASALLKNLLELPGRRRRKRNMLGDILGAVMWLLGGIGASQVWNSLHD